MSKATEETNEPESSREMVITRLINAPRERVFEAWTDLKQLELWWGPNGFKDKTREFSMKKGGVWAHTMIGPDGVDYPNKSVFEEVVRPERIVYSHGGGRTGDVGASFRAFVTFKAVGNKTELSLRSVFPTRGMRDHVVKEYGAIEGGHQTLARLAELIEHGELRAGDWVFTRFLPAPRARVFTAWTVASELARWWGPNGFTAPRCESDPRPGGAIRIVMRAPDGSTQTMSGSFKEVKPPSRLVFLTSVPDPEGRPIDVEQTVILDEAGPKETRLTLRSRVVRVEPAALKLLNGMNQGWDETLDRLVANFATS